MTFTKQTAASDLWITYDDTLGWEMIPYGDAASWRLVLDGTALLENRVHSQQFAAPWWIMPYSLQWYLQGIAAGSHTVRIQSVKMGGAASTLQGWPEQGLLILSLFHRLIV